MLFEIFKAVIFGIVEGICEWLPISSTGHLILLEEFLSLDISNDQALNEQFANMFDVVIQLGAVLAIAVLYFKKFDIRKKENITLWKNIIIATLPAAIIGFAADKICEKLAGVGIDTLLFNPKTVATALIIYGILFIAVEKTNQRKNGRSLSVTPLTAFLIGCFQSLAIIPGTSRSGATILGARILGIDRCEATEFSFFAAIPIIFGASALKIFEFFSFMRESSLSLPSLAITVLTVAFTVSFLVSVITVKLLTDFVKKHTFIPFGIYRIILGIAVLIIIK